MNLEIGYTSDDVRKIKKNFTIEKTLTVNLKDNTSITHPVFLVSAIPVIDTIVKYNYCYVPKFKRRYFINNITLNEGGIAEIECSVDVLKTYESEILNCDCVIARNTNEYNAYLDDEKFKTYNYNRIQTKTFPQGFTSNPTIVMTTV